MGQRAITIYTPEGTAPHISAEDDAFIHRCAFGGTSGILGSLSCVRVDDNTVRLSGGGVSNRGYILRIPDGENVELAVDNGEPGKNRIDAVAAVFTKGGGDVADTHSFAVVKGTSAAGSPAAPALADSAPASVGDVCRLALFYVSITGTQITGVSRVAPSLPASGSLPSVTYGSAAPSGGSEGSSVTATGILSLSTVFPPV